MGPIIIPMPIADSQAPNTLAVSSGKRIATIEKTICCKEKVHATWNLNASATEALQESNQYWAQQEYVTKIFKYLHLRVIHSIDCSKAQAANYKAEVSQNYNVFTSETCLPWTNQWGKEYHGYLIDPILFRNKLKYAIMNPIDVSLMLGWYFVRYGGKNVKMFE